MISLQIINKYINQKELMRRKYRHYILFTGERIETAIELSISLRASISNISWDLSTLFRIKQTGKRAKSTVSERGGEVEVLCC